MATTTEVPSAPAGRRESASARAEPAQSGPGEPAPPGGSTPLLRLMQISSSLFPIGAFAYSQGLEQAVERGWVDGEESLVRWVTGVGGETLQRLELPLLLRACDAFQRGDTREALGWSRRLLCSREARELREQELHLGRAFARALSELGVPGAVGLAESDSRSYAAAYALAASHFAIGADQACHGYAFAWAEQQVGAAQRLLPVGHLAGQRALSAVLQRVPEWVRGAASLGDEEVGSATPALAMAAAWHEVQYSRLFRS